MRFGVIAPKLSSDAAGGLYDAGGMDEKAIRRAALITLRRAIYERFPRGPERRAWLGWVQSRADDTPLAAMPAA